MASRRNILVVDRDPRVEEIVARLAKAKNPSVLAKVVSTMSDALRELELAGYDAVLLRVDGPGEMSLLLRIKESAPDIPVVALVPKDAEELQALARETGADVVQPTEKEEDDRFAEMDRILGTSDDLIRRSRAVRQVNRALFWRLHFSLAKSAALSEQSLKKKAELNRELDKQLSFVSLKEFRPLLVEDDPDQAMFLTRCFNKLGVSLSLPIMRDGEEAIAYLSRGGGDGDRANFSRPGLVISDLRLPRKSGHEVIAWIRSQPSYKRLIVFMLTSSEEVKDRDRALDLGADGYFIKPLRLEDLHLQVKLIVLRWSRLEKAYRFGT